MSKRQKFVLTSLVLALGFLIIQLGYVANRYLGIGGLTGLALLLSFWSLRSGLGLNARLLTLVLPITFTAGVGLFYFLLPATAFTAIPVLILYALGMYALLLTANIYTISAIRTIALLRAAHAAGFLLIMVTTFLLLDTLLSLRLSFWANGFLTGLVVFPLVLQGNWSFELEDRIGQNVLVYSGTLSFICAQAAALLSFWPVSVAVGALFLTTVVYVGLGITQAKLQGRLFAKTVQEYLLAGIIVYIAMFITSKWGG